MTFKLHGQTFTHSVWYWSIDIMLQDLEWREVEVEGGETGMKSLRLDCAWLRFNHSCSW
jgi:hypothetical protein